MNLTYNKELYSKMALLKAAYHFTDNFYVYLDQDDKYFYVDIDAKDGIDETSFGNKFSNELLAQVTREEILKKTSNIREMILGRAFATTIIEKSNTSGNSVETKPDDDNLFKDWYESET